MITLNCFAIDDEPYALDLTNKFIEQTPFLKLTGSFTKPVDAMSAIHEQRVDLLFLDIEMPELGGIEFATMLNQNIFSKPPLVVFTTAYDHFALAAYKLNVLDYLLKPFSYDEFLRVANKAVKQTAIITDHGMSEADHMFIKVEYNLIRTDYKDIIYIEGLKDYVKIYTRNSANPILSLTSLKALEEKLPGHRFMRVHRSHIIGLDHITSMTKTSLQMGRTTIPIGEQFKDTIRKFVESRTA